ncbi:MAG: flagellin, partial [Eubacteriales bacterium]|nr:flagellin [Eubacteriales bacterium]
GDALTVYAKTEGGDAPMVLGKGLTLQIGDTSDSWNQLSVGVQDMHDVSLGLEGLDISKQGMAQAAIDKIKT